MPNDRNCGLSRQTAGYRGRAFSLSLRRSFARSVGYSQAMLERPVIGIVDTASGRNNCRRTVPDLVEAVKRGVFAAGGLGVWSRSVMVQY